VFLTATSVRRLYLDKTVFIGCTMDGAPRHWPDWSCSNPGRPGLGRKAFLEDLQAYRQELLSVGAFFFRGTVAEQLGILSEKSPNVFRRQTFFLQEILLC
jgi:hypothetical protein